MKPLWVGSVNGLYHELYEPNCGVYSDNKKIINKQLDVNSIFWSILLDEKRIDSLITKLQQELKTIKSVSPQFISVASNPSLFKSKIRQAAIYICDAAISPKDFFVMIETLSILCEIYSVFEFRPFRLTLQDGFQLNDFSSEEISRNSATANTNPYYHFSKKEIFPIIKEYNPNILFLCGKINYFTLTLARLVKLSSPNTHICITRHSSEYYSLNKIDLYLTKNKHLFSIIDSIILEYFESTERQIIQTLRQKNDISTVPNLIFKNEKLEIKKNVCSVGNNCDDFNIRFRKSKGKYNLSIPPKKIANIHLEPLTKCYWNKCNFCGINEKYSHTDNSTTLLDSRLNRLTEYTKEIDYLWFTDEAIHPQKLLVIARNFIEHETNIRWQARCRIEKSLLENNLPYLLAKSGLTELRLGLESASYAVLKAMGKFEEDFSLELLYKIVKEYSKYDVSIHLPMIIGFPGERHFDRQKTYEFLSKLKSEFPTLTFNINRLIMDVSSSLFSAWHNFPITGVSLPCLPENYIGNFVNWNSELKESDLILDKERNYYMRNSLYSWMPLNSVTEPVILYRLSETIRHTLVWKSRNKDIEVSDFELHNEFILAEDLVVSQTDADKYLVYNFGSHHYIEGNHYLLEVLNVWETPHTVLSGIKTLINMNPNVFISGELNPLVKQLHGFGFLVAAN